MDRSIRNRHLINGLAVDDIGNWHLVNGWAVDGGMNDMTEWIAQLSNKWALAIEINAQKEEAYIAAYRDGNFRRLFYFSLHPRKKTRWDKFIYLFLSPLQKESFAMQFCSMNEAIRMAYEYILDQLEAEKIAAEKEQLAKEILEEAKTAGKMFQMADAALQKCLVGESK